MTYTVVKHRPGLHQNTVNLRKRPAILSRMSRLRVVRCHSLLGFYNMQLKTPIVLLNLEHLYLELNNLPFDQFKSLMTNISSPLQSLGICTTNDDHYVSADKLDNIDFISYVHFKEFLFTLFSGCREWRRNR